MKTLSLTAADFRLHLPRILEKVAYDGTRVMVQRYGHQMVAVVPLEDLEYLEQNKPRRNKKRKPEFQRTHAAAEALGLMGTSQEDAVAKMLALREQQRVLKERVREEEERRRKEAKAARQAAEAAARAEAEKKAKEEQRIAHLMRITPEAVSSEEMLALYRKIVKEPLDNDRWSWLGRAYRLAQMRGVAEGLEAPPGMDALMQLVGVRQPSA